ncbi:phosphoheptose isomerase [Clostridium gelidum]|uniref:Phosphoheptose isomerase n=1 Tax=Clostridium gelidum TaxID=704125 RepID=A0ABN6J086_9CLOT|nr:SIS domain-containing protein [Clostridium gelidum]BCZ47103.1 phosphoheptose isomerase [Clostridium gelidum]
MRILEEKLNKHIELLIKRYEVLQSIKEQIANAYFILEDSFKNGGKLLIAGNGGSAADAEHITGELMKSFKKKRKVSAEFAKKLIEIDSKGGEELAVKLQEGLPTIALSNHAALTTAYLNDVDGLLCFAQQVNGYGKNIDIFLGISTSGNSNNILYAAITAKAKGMKVIGLTGRDGGRLKDVSDVSIIVPENETYIIQELHLPIYHCWCLMLEDRFFCN